MLGIITECPSTSRKIQKGGEIFPSYLPTESASAAPSLWDMPLGLRWALGSMALPPKYSADFCNKTAFILPLSSPPMAKCPIRKYLSGPSKFSVQPRGSVS